MRKLYGVDLITGYPVIELEKPEKVRKSWKNSVAIEFIDGDPCIPLFDDPDKVARATGGLCVDDEQHLFFDGEITLENGEVRDYITQWSIVWDSDGSRGGIAGSSGTATVHGEALLEESVRFSSKGSTAKLRYYIAIFRRWEKVSRKISVNIPDGLYEKIEECVKSGMYRDMTDVIVAALRNFFNLER